MRKYLKTRLKKKLLKVQGFICKIIGIIRRESRFLAVKVGNVRNDRDFRQY